MKNILCFGDSNTWGYDPATQTRFDNKTRWTGVLQKEIGDKFNIIEQGLNGRTTKIDETLEHNFGYARKFRSSTDILPIIYESHSPLDLLVIMLGTNDLKTNFNRCPKMIADDMKDICKLVLNSVYYSGHPIVLISPTHINESSNNLMDSFIGTKDYSMSLAPLYEKIAENLGLFYLDASKVIFTNQIDGLHWDKYQHNEFGRYLSKFIKSSIF